MAFEPGFNTVMAVHEKRYDTMGLYAYARYA
jgi:hypothetical protein